MVEATDERALPAAGQADEGGHVVPVDLERDVLERRQAVVRDAQVLTSKTTCRAPRAGCRRSSRWTRFSRLTSAIVPGGFVVSAMLTTFSVVIAEPRSQRSSA